MAKKIEKRKKMADPEQADDLDILYPEQTMEISGRAITMKEYSFGEVLKHRRLMQPLVDGLRRLAGETGTGLSMEDILDMIADNHELIVRLIALACDQEKDWVEGLSASAGNDMLYLWWSVNGPFLMRSAMQRLAEEAVKKAALIGQTSTPTSSETATALTPSDDTPSGSYPEFLKQH